MVTDHYEIRVRHSIGPEMMHLLAEYEPEIGTDSTLLRTTGADQPSLHGTLDRLASLGLEIISVQRTDR